VSVSVVYLSLEGQKAFRFHQKDLHLLSEDERTSYVFDMRVSNK